MPIKVTMPALSPTMEEGNLARWLKQEGDAVAPGDVIAEIETDKATMEVESVDEGTMGKIVVAEGTEGVKVNATIAWLLEDGEDASAIPDGDGDEDGAEAASTDQSAEAKGKPVADDKDDGADKKADTAKADTTKADDGDKAPDASDVDDEKPAEESEKLEKTAATQASGEASDRIIASPLARRMAKQADLDLGALKGSGPKGRIIKADIEQALTDGTGASVEAATSDQAAPAAARPTTARAALEAEDIPHTNVRKVIAKRLTEADRDVPQFYLSIDCEIDALLAARKEINEALDGEAKVSVNDMVIKAAALALRKVPAVNAQWTDTAMKRLGTVDVSIAVAYEGGLITPIVFDADQKGLAQISIEMKDLAGRAKDGKLKPEEYQGGGFSISNLGMFGINHFTAIINPPQSAILAVGAGEQRVVVRDGEMKVATVMTCTMTCDHRVVDGALGAQWLNVFKGFIEKPASMLA